MPTSTSLSACQTKKKQYLILSSERRSVYSNFNRSTIGLRTSSHHGLGNKLYYIMENGTPTTDRDTPPDSQLQELLPHSPVDSSRLY
ncbi:leucine-rich repeat-containing protein 15 [Caerostris extrusa]|uniref:Leucine-rich repeat-containing protein 15 n=1 Tax=Caerostris extrusa TaxID=172846 RepID=A0AAV4QYU2_CAEEX|nr:leucine-rich repeat-containing protein 15 [Caerostris extrusa]